MNNAVDVERRRRFGLAMVWDREHEYHGAETLSGEVFGIRIWQNDEQRCAY